ncbi:hypothetical protein K504DRAFT_461893 [Pleomassaria siparia CBS 279.74]|uniref:HTH La-type RNA-binding domain-containing protein n=1 Tax=Pleomassaria siparia CBS 279.74 TaxID=1314801 RepID=A0A6G1KKJ5_9PLEO|nr:hypothetical protein K504DRAFT_461893 [Pleomassaria siparia CBS 279.74]
MSDTQPAAEKASNNPTEVVAQTEASAQTSGEKPAVAEAATDSKVTEAPAEQKSEEKNGDSAEVAKTESSAQSVEKNGDSKRSDRRDDRNNHNRNDKNDRYSRNDRGNKRNGSYNDRHQNKKRNTEFENLPETDDPVEIRSQVEFYFSVANLHQDRHMFLEIKGAENRPVSLKHITSFKRMRRFQPYTAIVAALRDSEDLVVIEDGDFAGAGKEGVQRKEPLSVPKHDNDDVEKPTTEDLYYRMVRASKNQLDNCVYVKGFGDEKAAGQIALEQFFKPYGSVMVRKRRSEDNEWKNSVFVEFDTQDSAQQFLALDPKPTYNGNELLIKSKRQYSEDKCREKGIKPEWEREAGDGNGHRNNYRERDGRGGGRGRGNGRGRGRGGNDRGRGRDNRHSDRHDNRNRRDRSNSRDSRDNKDWNSRRDKFQKSGYNDKRDRNDKSDQSQNDKPRSGKMDDKDNSIHHSKSVIRDADGVPIIKDTREEPSKSSSKRKADDDVEATTKKTKIEIKVDA